MEKQKIKYSKKVEENNKEKKLISKKAKSATISTLISFIIGIISSLISSIGLITNLKVESKYSQIILIGFIFFAALTIVYFISKYLQRNKSKSPVLTLKKVMIDTYITAIDNSIYNPKLTKGQS